MKDFPAYGATALTSPIRVLHTESSPSLGGQELRILLEMEKMVPMGFESHLAARPDTPILQEASRRGLSCFPVPIRSSLDIPAILHFRKLIKTLQIDVVNAHNSKDGWNVALAARSLNIPVIRSRHIANPIRSGKISRMIYGPLCQAVMTTSESIRNEMILRGVAADKIISVPTGVDAQRFAGGTPGQFRRSLNIPEDVPLIGQVSVLRGSKGPHIFLEAAQRLISEGFPAWFVLVGEGPALSQLRNSLEKQPSKQILLAGYRSDIPDVLADLDLFVLAATQPEGVPQAILQAFAAEVPVIASNLGGINEVARHDETALTVPARDPEQLANAIRSVLEEMNEPESATNRRCKRARQLANSSYSLEHTLKSMENMYRNAIKKPKHSP